MLHILPRVIEAHLHQSSAAGPDPRFGAVSFIHRFSASLNRDVHYHCWVIEGVFEPIEDAGESPQSLRFFSAADLTPEALAAIAEQVLRVRVLRWFARSGLIESDDARQMLAWENSGRSLDAAARVAAHDRAGLERMLRYCARLGHVRFAEHCCRWQPKGALSLHSRQQPRSAGRAPTRKVGSLSDSERSSSNLRLSVADPAGIADSAELIQHGLPGVALDCGSVTSVVSGSRRASGHRCTRKVAGSTPTAPTIALRRRWVWSPGAT